MSSSLLPRHLHTTLRTHSQKVCSLYKRAIRDAWSSYDDPDEYRYHARLVRERFDKNKDIKDFRKAKILLAAGEKEYEENKHYQPRQFAYSPGGINYGRVVSVPDWVLDYWHPLEKARYPEYFARREQRKAEFIERWEMKYGKPQNDH